MAFTQREEVVMCNIERGPQSKARKSIAVAIIDLPPAEQRVFGGNVPVDTGKPEVLRGSLRTYEAYRAYIRVTGKQRGGNGYSASIAADAGCTGY